jgi:hypothetical protein
MSEINPSSSASQTSSGAAESSRRPVARVAITMNLYRQCKFAFAFNTSTSDTWSSEWPLNSLVGVEVAFSAVALGAASAHWV